MKVAVYLYSIFIYSNGGDCNVLVKNYLSEGRKGGRLTLRVLAENILTGYSFYILLSIVVLGNHMINME